MIRYAYNELIYMSTYFEEDADCRDSRTECRASHTPIGS